MKCLDCRHMACKVFTAKTETWNGFCVHHRRTVNGDDSCNIQIQLFE